MMKFRSNFLNDKDSLFGHVFKRRPKVNVVILAMLLIFLFSTFIIASNSGYSFGVKTFIGEIIFEPKHE